MVDFTQLAVFFLVLVRVTAFLVTSPLFAVRNVPALVKVGLGFALALVVYPVLPRQAHITMDTGAYILNIGAETLVGLLLGYGSTLLFEGLRLAGQFIDLDIGFAMANVFDPINGVSTTLVAQFINLLALLLFLVMDGHYLLLAALVKSFTILPLGAAKFQAAGADALLAMFSSMFAIALQVSVPVLAVLVIMDVAMGLVSRTVPQLNVLMLGFPVKIVVGVLALSMMVPLMGVVMNQILTVLSRDLAVLLKGLT